MIRDCDSPSWVTPSKVFINGERFHNETVVGDFVANDDEKVGYYSAKDFNPIIPAISFTVKASKKSKKSLKLLFQTPKLPRLPRKLKKMAKTQYFSHYPKQVDRLTLLYAYHLNNPNKKRWLKGWELKTTSQQ